METKKEFFKTLTDYRQLVSKKFGDYTAYKRIEEKIDLYKQLDDQNRVIWVKEYLAKYPPVFTAEELL